MSKFMMKWKTEYAEFVGAILVLFGILGVALGELWLILWFISKIVGIVS